MADKKFVFSEEVDSTQSGQALGLSFLAVGLILQFLPLYFCSALITNIIKYAFIVFGVLGMCVELGKKQSNIKGVDNFLLGILFTVIWWALMYKFDNIFINIASFILLFFGLYALFLGIQQIIYSIVNIEKNTKIKNRFKNNIIEFITKLLGIILIVAQITNAVLDINI